MQIYLIFLFFFIAAVLNRSILVCMDLWFFFDDLAYVLSCARRVLRAGGAGGGSEKRRCASCDDGRGEVWLKSGYSPSCCFVAPFSCSCSTLPSVPSLGFSGEVMMRCSVRTRIFSLTIDHSETRFFYSRKMF